MAANQKKILVVEDDDSLRDMLVIIFEDEDYYVAAASNGEQALQMLDEEYFDLLATDLYMPKVNGFELSIQCQKKHPETKIILFSGGGREITATHGKGDVQFQDEKIKIDMFIKKPCDLTELLGVIEKMLG